MGRKVLRDHRSVVVEVFLGLSAIVLIPIILRLTGSITNPLFFVLGFNDLLGQLTGQRGQTDIGWEVSASAGLVNPEVSAYAPLGQLGPLIGMDTVENVPHIHPPPALSVFVPLAFIAYSTRLGSWIVAMIMSLAWTLRVTSVAPWVAYPVALGLSLTRVGQFSLSTTYPLLALCIALAWRYRSGHWTSGIALGLITGYAVSVDYFFSTPYFVANGRPLVSPSGH